MRFEKYLKENADQLAIPGMATRTPHVWGSNNPDTVYKKCPEDQVWNEAKGRCEKGLPSQEVRFQGGRPAKSRITSEEYITEAARNLPYYNNCVNWTPREQEALSYIIDEGEEISRREYVRATNSSDREQIEESMGYGPHFKIEKDWSVTYERVPGFDCVYMNHSAIEYVFATPQTIRKIQRKAEEEY